MIYLFLLITLWKFYTEWCLCHSEI